MGFSLAKALILGLLFQYVQAATNATTSSVRSIFLFKDVLKSDTDALTTSGFNSLIIFGIGILENGDIMYYSNTPGSKDTLVAGSGSYVGGDALAEKVRSFKTRNGTQVDRVEISMNAQHIRDLMLSPGFKPETPLYRNLAALREAWGLDAVNNDDETTYDLASTIAFAEMVGKIGYKYTVSPYTDPRVWAAMRAEINANRNDDPLLDRIYLQCYDGGAGNNPATWANLLGMKVVPLVWVVNDSKPSFSTTVAQAKTKFSAWNQNKDVLAGGGYWNDYDIEKMKLSYADYGNVLKTVFP